MKPPKLFLFALCAFALSACGPRDDGDKPLSVEQALAECQAAVEGANNINAKGISEKDAASGYTITGFVVTSCMEKHRFRCTQDAPNAPCTWSPSS